jgi:hypothetical protein
MAMAGQAHTKPSALRAEEFEFPAAERRDAVIGNTSTVQNGERASTAKAAATSTQASRAISALDVLAYQRDVLERSILFFDTLRRRANAMLEHERLALPPLLNFKSEALLDARQFDPPANYALLRISEVGDKCWDDCVDPAKPPVIVIDPRAGHGPGPGGFKR